MNWFDILLIVVVGGSALSSLRNGFTREVIGLISLLAAFLLASWTYGQAGAFLLPFVSAPGVANFAGYVLVFLATLALGGLVGFAAAKLLKLTGLSWFDRLLGGAFGFVKGALAGVAVVMILMAFTPGSKPDAPPGVLMNSRFAPYLVEAAQVMSLATPHELKEGFRKSYEEMHRLWRGSVPGAVKQLPSTEL